MNVIDFCSELIKKKSITPNDAGSVDYVADFLLELGFDVKILMFNSIDDSNSVKNLFAKYGNNKSKTLGFLGHLDVVPAGEGWEAFSATIENDYLIGRGVADMKGSIAAFCCAIKKYIKTNKNCNISFFLTCDEEIGSFEGTQSLIKWAVENNFIPDDCLIGEPSSEKEVGDRIYIGHRGSLNVQIKSFGKQGHVAYDSKNSLTNVCRYISKISDYNWKHDDKVFPKTKTEPTLLYTNNYAINVVPDETFANINIRYSSDYNSNELKSICLNEAENLDLSITFIESGDAYCCKSHLQELLSKAIKNTTGIDTKFSTSGGISDGRYMIKLCNIIEFGLQDSTIHQKNEKVRIEDIIKLENIYLEFLNLYFS